jgi:hypothetical protein
LVFPAAAVGMAAFANEQGWGLLNYYPFPATAAIVVSVIAMVFIVYLQHVTAHAVPVLWRLGRVTGHAIDRRDMSRSEGQNNDDDQHRRCYSNLRWSRGTLHLKRRSQGTLARSSHPV